MTRAAYAIAILLAVAGCKRVGTLDEGKVHTASELHPQTLEKLRARGLLREGEQLLTYYYRGVDDHIYLLTDQRLSRTIRASGDAQTIAIPLDELVAVTHAPMPVGTMTTARGRDGTQIMFVIAGINRGSLFRQALDQEFAKRHAGEAR